MDRGDGRARLQLEAAYEQVAAQPSGANRQVFPLTTVARAIGASRSQLYRHWETAAELAEDMTVMRATTAAGWQERLRAELGSERFDVVLERVLHEPRVSEGTAARSVLSVEPVSSLGRARVAAWEREWIVWFADHLRATHEDRPGVPWTDLAISVTAVIEGALLLLPMLGGHGTPSGRSIPSLLATTAQRMCDHVVAHVPGADIALRVPDDAAVANVRVLTPGALALLARVQDAFDRGRLTVGAAGDQRIVNMAQLARTLDVSTRRVFDIWPTASDLNADLFGISLEKVQQAAELVSAQAFVASSETIADDLIPILVDANDKVLDADRFPQIHVLLRLMEVLDNAAVRARFRDPFTRWFTTGQMFGAAILQSTNRILVDGLTIPDYTLLAMSGALGGWRLSALHPDVHDHRLDYVGRRFRSLAVGLDVISQVWVTEAPAG